MVDEYQEPLKTFRATPGPKNRIFKQYNMSKVIYKHFLI